MITLVVIIVIAALIFDFINGFHDAANAISTIVISKTLNPLQAVALAAFANFVGYFTFGTAVAKMVGKGVVNIDSITLQIILATVIGAIVWNLITWYLGIPTSSSHALIGALIGAGVSAKGLDIIVIPGIVKILVFIIIAPLLGMAGAFVFTIITMRLCSKSNPRKMSGLFRKLQLVSATFYSIGHGTNDAQKTMGIIALTLFTAGINHSFIINHWVIVASYTSIALGTIFGGWRIVKTMGTNITKIRQMEGFCAETAAAFVLIGTAHAGIPVSTTHVIAGSIMGVGSVENISEVKWLTARNIMWAWMITIPISAVIAGLCYFLIDLAKASPIVFSIFS